MSVVLYQTGGRVARITLNRPGFRHLFIDSGL